jgi:hypothetical protein
MSTAAAPTRTSVSAASAIPHATNTAKPQAM